VILKYGIKTHTQKIGLSSRELKRLSIDETALSNGELYTILTNKAARKKNHSSYDCWN
jgi:hypothetical protein